LQIILWHINIAQNSLSLLYTKTICQYLVVQISDGSQFDVWFGQFIATTSHQEMAPLHWYLQNTA